MAQDESDFEKLLKEAREWDARDRARHRSSAMTDDDDGSDPFPAASRAPTVSVDELEKQAGFDSKRGQEPPKMQPQKPAASIKIALKSAVKQAQAQAATGREKRKGGWGGWIWIAILLYFVIKHYFAR